MNQPNLSKSSPDSEPLLKPSSSQAQADLDNVSLPEVESRKDTETIAYPDGGYQPDGNTGDVEMPPDRLGRYRILRTLGYGAFGRVFLAHDDLLHCDVAIKHPKRRAGDKGGSFLAEARAVAPLKHPNIVRVRDVCQEPDGSWFVVMDYIDGMSLADRLGKDPISPPEAARLIEKVARAVHAAHRQGFVHRDLKPANILLDRSGEPFVADFGLALHEDAQAHCKGELAGTLPYMAPEQLKGDAHHLDGRTDIWSLGVILYELLAQRRPFRGADPDSLCEEIQSREPKPPRQFRDDVPADLERICLKCLSKKITDRYATADDLADDIKVASLSIGPSDARAPKSTRRRLELFGSLGGIGCGVAVTLAVVIGTIPFIILPLATPPIRHAIPPNIPQVANIDVQFKQAKDDATHFVVDRNSLPLKTGELVRVAGRFAPAMYPVVAVVSDDVVQIAYPRTAEELAGQKPLSDWTVPLPKADGSDNWWELKPPDGTLTFVVLASATPIADAAELESIKQTLSKAGGFPRVGAMAMVRFEGKHGKLDAVEAHHDRAIGSVEETVATPGSAMAKIAETLGDRFAIIRAVAVPQRTAR